MSRGPGSLQRRLLQCWPCITSSALRYSGSGIRERAAPTSINATADAIQASGRGRYVPISIPRRNLGCSAADLSRALGGLEGQGLAFRYDCCSLTWLGDIRR